MVRETRHLWVGNLPENIREDRIRDHFKRYGRVQSVKLLPRGSGRGSGNGNSNDSTSTVGCTTGGNTTSGGSNKDEDSGGTGTNSGSGAGGTGAGNSGTNNNTSQGLCATVSFMDIKSAAKAHHSEQKLDDRTLTTEYHEPAAIPGATSQLYSSSTSSSQQSARFSSSHGSSEEVGGPGFDRSSHFYDRSDSTTVGSGNSASGTVASGNTSGGYLRRGTPGGTGTGPASAPGYHTAPDGIPPPASRSRTRDRLYRNGPYPPLIDRDTKQRLGEPRKSEGEDLRHSRLYCYRAVLNSNRSQGNNSSNNNINSNSTNNSNSHHRVSSSSWGGYDCPSPRYTTSNQIPATTPDITSYSDDRRENTPLVHKKHSKSSISRRSGSDSGSNSGSSRSRSSSASSQSGSSTCSTASSSPAPSDKSCSTHSQQSAALRSGSGAVSSAPSTHTNSNSPAVHSEDRRPLAICVRNLPARSSDTSLKDGLYHEYKKHGKVTWVKVVGQGVDRYALVCFKKPDDVEKALQVSHDKLFFGCKIEVAPYEGYDVDDNEFRPFEAEQDEFHPKATRTLFIGNLEKDTTAPEIRKHFEQFGEIIDIDVKKQGTSSTYAFCQFSDISSVVRAMRTLDGEHVGQNRIKLGFGKSMHTNSVWVDGVAESVSEKYLSQQFGQFGPVSHVVIDRSRGHALVFYEQIPYAQQAVKEMRGVVLRGRKLQVDYASRECQEAFYDRMDKQANSASSTSTSFDNNSVPVTAPTSVSNLRVFDSSSNTNPAVTSNVTNRYSTNTGSNAIQPSNISGTTAGSGRYSGNPNVRTSSTYGNRSNSTISTSPATSGAQPTVSSLSQVGIRSTASRQQVNTSSSGQRFDYSNDYVQDRRSYRSYEDGSEDPGGGSGISSNSSEIRHLQKERVGLLEGGATSPASAAVNTIQEEGRRRCAKHRRSESTSGTNATTNSNITTDNNSGAPSRPGTPLCDERPENLPVEPRRTPRDRSLDPLSLPLPRFAAQVLSPRGQPPRSSPPASPSHNFSSSDSEPSPPSPEWEERLRSLDERYEKWSGSRSGLTKIDPSTLKIRHKLLDLDVNELPPSDIVKCVLAKRSVFDEDSKRLENFGDKYEPKEFIPAPRTSFLRRLSPVSKSPGLQYPFPSHPPVQPTTTSVATTTAPSPSVLTSATEVKPSVTFLNCTRPQHVQPKISSPSVAVAETIRSPLPTVLHDKFKPKVKTEPTTVVKKETTPITSTPTLVPSSPSISTPPKPKPLSSLRRDSADEKTDVVRRKSRDESSIGNPLESAGNTTVKKEDTSESDKVRDAQVCERRKSVSAISDKRRASVDSKTGDNQPDSSKHQKESNDKKEDRRRGSSELSEHHSAQPTTLHHKQDNAKKLDSSITSDNQFNCVDTNEKNSKKSLTTENVEKRREVVEHSVVRHNSTEVQDKKKDVLGVNSERDRRKARESTDSSHDNHGGKHNRKVPENKKDISEPSVTANEKRDDTVNRGSGSESLADKKRDNSDNVQASCKHREKKEHHSQDKEKRRDSSEQVESKVKSERTSPEKVEASKHKEPKRTSSTEQSSKRDHDSEQKVIKKEPEESSRISDDARKEPDVALVKHRDSDRRRNSENEISKEHSLFKKVFGFAESLRHHKERRDSDSTAVKTDESNKHRREHSSDKEKRKEKEVNEDGTKHKSVRKSPDNPESNKHKEEKKRHVDSNNRKVKKEYDNSEDGRAKETVSDHSESYHSKSREDKKKEERKESKTLYLSASDGNDHNAKANRDLEKKKDISSTLVDKKADDTDSLETIKKESDKKEVENYYERRKDSTETNRNKEAERRKSIDKYYDNEKYRETDRKKDEHDNCNYKEAERKNDTSTSLENIKTKHSDKHRENERRKEHDNLENCRVKETDRKRDLDSHERHKSGEKKKDNDGHRIKEEKKNEDSFDALKNKENERKVEESYDRLKIKDDGYNRYRDYIRKKEADSTNERKKDGEKERRKERDQDIQNLKDSLEDRKKDSDKEKKRIKEYEIHEPKLNGDHDGGVFSLDDCRKSCVTYDDNEHRVESIKKEKRKEKSWPATIGCKRRLSSQDSSDINDENVKRSKPERRDSKDSGRSSGSSRKSSGEKHTSKGFKLLEEKIKEDKEREMRKKEEVHDNCVALSGEEKVIKPAIRKEKRNSGEKRKEERITKFKSRPRENGTASESDLGSGDDESKVTKRQQHSIFDIVDDEPAYISMYDKVKARSTKNMQKQEEEKRQEKLKEKFHQLKASRAKREEKKRSTSYDEDSDSEKGSCRRNKLLLTSSEEDGGSESDVRFRARKILYDTSEDDMVQTPRSRKTVFITDHQSETKCNRKIVSDVSEDDSVIKHSTPKVKSSRNISFEADTKSRKIMSDTSEDDATRNNSTTLKLNPIRIHSDESEADLGFEDSIRPEPISTKEFDTPVRDIFANRSVEVNHFTTNNDHQEQVQQNSSPESLRRNSLDSTTSEQPRKKSHKKKQKRQKTFEDNEDGSLKKHSSKKDKKKSHRDNDGEEEKKSRKKRSEREANNKIDEKFEDIFGSLSDDSEKTMATKWQINVYDSDSESERENIRKKEKKRREKKLRELNEAGRALEAKLMDNSVTVMEEPAKVKKKKRKKSRDEKIKHHQQRVEQEEAVVSILPKEENDQKCNIKIEPNMDLVKIEPEEVKDECRSELPHLGKLEIKIESDSEIEQLAHLRTQSISSLLDSPPPTAPPVLSKKPDIPGFGSEVDESIHETAVKSISESPRPNLDDSDIKFDDKIKSEEALPATNEEKPTPVISQEETEDAVAALLVDAFGGFESYTEDTPKPDTPVSEPDLQIDTDTEDTFDTIDFSKPPRTPDIPASYYARQQQQQQQQEQQQNDTREGLEERIMSLACSADSPLKDNKPLPMPRTPDVVFDKKPDTPDIDMSSSDSEKYPDKQSVVKNLTEIDQPSPTREESPEKEPSESHEEQSTEFSDQSVKDSDKVISSSLSQKSTTESPESTPPLQESEVNDLSKETEVPKLTLLIPKNVSGIQSVDEQQSKGIPSLSPITKSTENSSLSQSCVAQNYQKLERIQQISSKPQQATVLVQQPQPQNAQIVKPLNVQVINSPLAVKTSEQVLGIQIPPVSVHTPKLGSPKQIVHITTSQTQSSLAQPTTKPSSLIQNKPPPAKTIIIQQSPQQVTPALVPTKASSQQASNLQVKPQPAQHNMPAQHATAAQHAILKPTAHRLPVPYSPLKTNQNMINAHPHLIQSSTAHLIPIKVTTTHQSQHSPLPSGQSVAVSLANKTSVPPLLSTIKDSSNVTPAVSSTQKQLHIHVSQHNQHSPHSPQALISPQNLKLVRPVSATQPPPLQSITGVHHLRVASHIQQAPPRSPNPANVPLLQTVSVAGEHTKSVQNYITKQINPSITTVNCHGGMLHSPNSQSPHPEKVISLSPNALLQQPQQLKQQPQLSPIPLTQKMSTAVNVIKSSSVVSEPPKISTPQESNVLDISGKDEKSKLIPPPSSQHTPLFPVNSVETKEQDLEQSIPENKTIDEPEQTNTVDDAKPLNAVIQDLTLRAASKAIWKQTTSFTSEAVRQEPSKPIEQVVLALHKKATSIPQTVLSESLDSKKHSELDDTKTDITITSVPKTEISSPTERKSLNPDLSRDLITSESHSPNPNSTLDSTCADSHEQSETSASEQNNSLHTSSSSLTDVIEENSQIDQNSSDSLKIDHQTEGSASKSDDTNANQDDELPFQTERKSPSPLLADKKSDRKSPCESNYREDEGPEPKAPRKESTPDVQISTEDKVKSDIAPITPVTTRLRGGRRRKGSGVGGRGGGGVATRRTRLTNSSAPSPISTDIYEFRDDPEEERPRLILTIKSPPEPSATPVVHTSSTPSVQAHEALPNATNATPTTATTTRKSRRLQEKDGSRTTIDDTIDDVVRGRPGRRATRSSGQALSLPYNLQPETTRKSPRRRQAAASQQRQSSPTRSPQRSSPQPPTVSTPQPITTQSPVTTTQSVAVSSKPPTSSIAPQTVVMPQQVNQQHSNNSNNNSNDRGSSSPEPTTLIDPVTGLLIPMTESEEGQYVPLHSDPNRANAGATISKEDGEPLEKRPRLSVKSSGAATVQQPASTGQPPPPVSAPPPQQQPHQVQTSQQQQQPSITLSQERNHPAISVATNIVPLSSTVSASRGEELLGRTTPSAVSTASVSVPAVIPPVITPSRPSVVRPTTSSHSTASAHGLLLPQAKIMPNHASSVSRPPVQPSPSISHNPPPPLVVSLGSTSVHQSRLSSSNVSSSSSTSVTTVSGTTVTSVVPKAHLLQTSVRPSPPPPLPPVLAPPHGPPIGMPTPVAPKAHLLQVVGSSGAREGVVGSAAPHQGSILTGSVASPPPLRAHQQPVVTGASSARILVKDDRPPPQASSSRLHIKDDRTALASTAAGSARLMIKDDQRGAPPTGSTVPSAARMLIKESGASSAGCIVGIAGSSQPVAPPPPPRGQVMQAGMPVPAYEASLHGVVAELLPNPQWPRQSPPPAHQHSQPQQQQQQQQQQQGEVVHGYGPHHIQPAHYDYVHPQLMYQQYLREAALGGPYNRPLGGVVKTDLDDRPGSAAAASALVASPPLELRRGSPHDRTTDSPQVATVYMHHGPASRHHVYYDGPPPPPAHRPQPPPSSQSTAGRLQTPPHAGQAPPQADSLLMLLQRYPVMWQGLLALKNDQAAVQMHFVFGNHHLAQDSLPHNSDGSTPPLRIAQRMRLEQTQVEGVARKMQIDNEHCMLLALPCGRDHMDVLQQSTNLQSGFITYLQQKQAAGIINIAAPGSQQAAYVVHIFPACDFANESLARIAPDLLHRVADLAHLLIVIATV